VAGMGRQEYDLELRRYNGQGWRATFFPSGFEHSLTSQPVPHGRGARGRRCRRCSRPPETHLPNLRLARLHRARLDADQ
jgi:hypothetical protein